MFIERHYHSKCRTLAKELNIRIDGEIASRKTSLSIEECLRLAFSVSRYPLTVIDHNEWVEFQFCDGSDVSFYY